MAKFFSSLGKLFGLKSGEKPQSLPEHAKPQESLLKMTVPSKYYQTLEERLAGRGAGISPELLQRGTSALAAQRRAGLTEQTLPLISAQASARGVGRSTIPVQRAAMESATAERDIEQRLADLTIQSEVMKQQERIDALTKMGRFAEAEAEQQNLRAAVESGDFSRIETLRAQREAEEQAGVSRAVMTAGGALAGGLGALGTGGQVATVMGKPVMFGQTIQGATSGLSALSGAVSGGFAGLSGNVGLVNRNLSAIDAYLLSKYGVKS